MRLPVVRGLIARRILVNYRVDPNVLTQMLPAPFRPKLLRGVGLAGICLIRLQNERPNGFPAIFGVSSENAAHRVAVEWTENGVEREGVYIPRRDTSSWFNLLAGGRLFPGSHHRARFQVEERADRVSVALDSDDGEVHVAVAGTVTATLPPGSVFRSVAEASEFFEEGSLGYSATAREGEYDALELRAFNWKVEPLVVEHVESSFFENEALFPAGSTEFDSALLMRSIEHEWYARPVLRAPECVVAGAR